MIKKSQKRLKLNQKNKLLSLNSKTKIQKQNMILINSYKMKGLKIQKIQ